MMRFRAAECWLCAATLLLAVAGCGASGQAGQQAGSPASSTNGPDSRTITVFAAASLTESFTKIGHEFEKRHPGTDVRFNFAGSSTLARQLERGAPAGVFASANREQMHDVVDAGLVSGPAVFARNKLRIVTPAGNPADIDKLRDFADGDKAIALCAEQVPCGAAAQEAFAQAGVEPAADTLERDVKAVLTKVSLSEADAGLVYATDIAAAGDGVDGFDFPEAAAAVNDYQLAALQQAPHPKSADAFVNYVQSRQGQQILAEFGFMAPAS